MITNENMSKRTVLKTGNAKLFNKPVHLTHKTAGVEIAGSGTRITPEGWGVLFPETRSGRWFNNLHDAEAQFLKVTGGE